MTECKTEYPETLTEEEERMFDFSTPISVFENWPSLEYSEISAVHDHWKSSDFIEIPAVHSDGSCVAAKPRSDLDIFRSNLLDYSEKCLPFLAGKLRERFPNYIPVRVERDVRSKIPAIEPNKYRVHGDLPLGKFAEFIRRSVGHIGTFDVFFKKTEPPTDALMSAIDWENKDEDGFLRMTYNGVSESGGRGCFLKRKSIDERDEREKERKKESYIFKWDHLLQSKVPKKKRSPWGLPQRSKWNEEEEEAGINWNWHGWELEGCIDSCWQEVDRSSHLVVHYVSILDKWNGMGAGFVKPWNIEGPDSYKTHKTCKDYGGVLEPKEIDAFQLRKTTPDRIPLCVERDPKSDIPDIGATKYSVREYISVRDFLRFIQFMIFPYGRLKPMHIYVNNTEPPTDTMLRELDEEFKDADDGFLHLTYSW